MAVLIHGVVPGSPAQLAGLGPGCYLFAVDGNQINDGLDYAFYTRKAELELSVSIDGELRYLSLQKEEYQPLGLLFENDLMDRRRRCVNRCIFCPVDQLPKGLPSAMYERWDDERESHLYGTFTTLTNLNRHGLERMRKLHMSPISLAIHTVDPVLRAKMLGKAGQEDILVTVEELFKAGVEMRCLVVCCRGVNDGEYLQQTVEKLAAYYPLVRSIGVVAPKLAVHRPGLYPLEDFDRQSAARLLDEMKEITDKIKRRTGCRVAYPADIFYHLAGRELPPAEEYDELLFLEKEVGVCRLFHDEFVDELWAKRLRPMPRRVDLAAAGPFYSMLTGLAQVTMDKYPQLRLTVHRLQAETLGLPQGGNGDVMGRDIINQLEGQLESGRLLLPASVLQDDGETTADGMSRQTLQHALRLTVEYFPQSGGELLQMILRK